MSCKHSICRVEYITCSLIGIGGPVYFGMFGSVGGGGCIDGLIQVHDCQAQKRVISMIVQTIACAFLSESEKSKVPHHMPLSSVMRKKLWSLSRTLTCFCLVPPSRMPVLRNISRTSPTTNCNVRGSVRLEGSRRLRVIGRRLLQLIF